MYVIIIFFYLLCHFFIVNHIHIRYIVCVYRFSNLGWPMLFCQELGYPGSESSVHVILKDPNYTSSYPNTFKSPSCTPSTAKSMADCGQDWNPHCDYKQDVYITCSKTLLAASIHAAFSKQHLNRLSTFYKNEIYALFYIICWLLSVKIL